MVSAAAVRTGPGESYKLDAAFSCSVSLVDLLILILRYKNTCEQLIALIIPPSIKSSSSSSSSSSEMSSRKMNAHFFKARYTCLNAMYAQLYRLVKCYANNLMALDVCAAPNSQLVSFFGQEVSYQELCVCVW